MLPVPRLGQHQISLLHCGTDTHSPLTRPCKVFKLRKFILYQPAQQGPGHAFARVLVSSDPLVRKFPWIGNMSSSPSEDGSDDITQMTFGSGFKTRSISKVRSIFSFITVEPVVFLYALGFSLTMVITPVLYFDKTCKVSLKIQIKFSFFQVQMMHYFKVKVEVFLWSRFRDLGRSGNFRRWFKIQYKYL